MCQFGKAHVDLPLSGYIKSINGTIKKNEFIYNMLYPNGRNAEFPLFKGPQIVNHTLLNTYLLETAHGYAECSNKGSCDRALGTCNCMTGFEGSACQRNVCPKIGDAVCNSHGRCVSARYMAYADNQNIYQLWDADINYVCKCDPGYYGAVCEQRTCKLGYDPLYFDLNANSPMYETSRRYSNWTIVFTTFKNLTITGNYSIYFYDYNGREWLTDPIQYNASCLEITNSLESLPNSAIPKGSIRCVKWNNIFTSAAHEDNFGLPHSMLTSYQGIKYTLTFPLNPGRLKQIDIKTTVKNKPTLMASDYKINHNNHLKTYVYSDGFSGEHFEYFTSKCQQVDVSILTDGNLFYLGDLTDFERRLLEKCLGQSDDYTTYSGVGKVLGSTYNWDYGTIYNPHLIRLVPKAIDHNLTTDICPGVNNSIRGEGTFCEDAFPYSPGFLVPVIYDPVLQLFMLMTRPVLDYSSNTLFTIFNTDGVAQMVTENVTVFTDPENPYSKTIYTKPAEKKIITNSSFFIGNLDCTSTSANLFGAYDCVEKGKLVFILDPYNYMNNPKYMNLYVVNKVSTISRYTYVATRDIPSITLDMSMNVFWDKNTMQARVYTFYPKSSYNYVTECANRGLCNSDTGLCQCFLGYYGDNCGIQDNSLQFPYIIDTATII